MMQSGCRHRRATTGCKPGDGGKSKWRLTCVNTASARPNRRDRWRATKGESSRAIPLAVAGKLRRSGCRPPSGPRSDIRNEPSITSNVKRFLDAQYRDQVSANHQKDRECGMGIWRKRHRPSDIHDERIRRLIADLHPIGSGGRPSERAVKRAVRQLEATLGRSIRPGGR